MSERERIARRQVRYRGATDAQVQWGSHDDPRGVLALGQVYELESEDVHSWHTKYTLTGIKGRFNSVCFEEVADALLAAPAGADEIAAAIPSTFYAGTDTLFRVVQLVRIWQGAIRANQELEDQLATVTAQKEAAERNADFLRESIGECHLMLSRLVVDGIRYHLRQDWDATTLPARLFTLLTEGATATARADILGGQVLGLGVSLQGAEARVRALEGALGDLFALVAEGWLVRNTTNDAHLPSFMAESLRLVNTLAAVKALLQPEAPRGGGDVTCWLIERTDGPRPRWLAWRDRDAISWTPDAQGADRYDWWMPASRDARLIAATQGIACVAVEHMFLAPSAGGCPRHSGRVIVCEHCHAPFMFTHISGPPRASVFCPTCKRFTQEGTE